MKRLLWLGLITLFFATCFAIPAFAQQGEGEGEGGGEGFGGDISGADGPAISARGGPKVDVLADLRSWLAKAGAPAIAKNQEKPLSKLYDQQIKLMAKSFQTKFGVPLETALAAQSAAQAGGGRGRRGGGARTPVNPEQAAEIRKGTDMVMDKIIAALRVDQQGTLRKYQSEQLRVKRLNAMKQSLKLAGVSLTPEQSTQVDALYARESRLRTLAIVEAKGASVAVTISNLEKQTYQRALRALNPTQRASLATAVAKPRTP